MINNEIKILSDREHIIKRSGMYIGSSAHESHDRFMFGKFGAVKYVPGVIKLIDEIIDNSVDEAIRTNFKFANKISVDLKGNKIIVTDNGRGLPQADVVTPEGDTIPGPVAAWTRPRAGGNFGDDAERKTGGMNGVGSALTNIFSVTFAGATCDGKNEIVVRCSNGAENISWETVSADNKEHVQTKTGTIVSFIPDFSHFESSGLTQIDEDIIHDRLQTLSVVFPDIEFKFMGKKVQGNFKKYAKQFDEEAIVFDEDNCSMAIGRSEDGFRHLSYVNNIHTSKGGSHVDLIIDELSNELIPMLKRKYKLDVNKARIKECLTLVVFVRDMSNMRFDSQTKERLTSPWGEVKTHMNLDYKKLAQQVLKAEAIHMPIIEAMLARKLAAEKAAETKAAKKAQKAKVAKHIKPAKYGDDSVETTLFLTEGDSAIGYLINTRDRDLHGGYPLRGKVMNTWGMTAAEAMKNKEIFDICAITGLVIGEEFDTLNYKNIAIMTDADVDGVGSIYPSLLGFFSNWPRLFEEGRIRFVKTPVIIMSKGSEQKWYYSAAEYEAEKEKLSGWKLRYIKGLGSLEEDEYERVIQQPVYDVVSLPDNWKELFEMVMGNDAAPRKVWMSE